MIAAFADRFGIQLQREAHVAMDLRRAEVGGQLAMDRERLLVPLQRTAVIAALQQRGGTA